MSFVNSSGKKELNVELNLMPVFDVMAVCICFLLMTVVWIQVGSMNTSQALGGQSQSETKNPPSVWLTVDEKANVTLSYRNTKQKMYDQLFKNQNGQINWNNIERQIQNVGQNKIGFHTAIIMPARKTTYNDVIRFMDLFRTAGVSDVGLSPL
jgi:biopolymer transport protein ExbD